MRFSLEIDCDNAAFDDAPATELIRIIRQQVIPAIQNGEESMKLRDSNGNTVGKFQVTGER